MVYLLFLLQSTFSGPAVIVDGDTLRMPQLPQRIRLWGIDTPELNTEAGQHAKAYLEGVIGSSPVNCRPKGQDRYRRIVAQCFVQNKDIARVLIENEIALEWCRYSKGHYGTCSATRPNRPQLDD